MGFLEGKSPQTPTTAFSSDALFYPETAKYLIEKIMPELALKPLFEDFVIKAGATATIPKQRGARTFAAVGRTADGSPINFNGTDYDTIAVTPYKIGMRVRVTREVVEDDLYMIVDDQLRRASRKVIYSIDSDIAQLFDLATKKRFAWLPWRRYSTLDDALAGTWEDDYLNFTVALNDGAKPSLVDGFDGLHVVRSPAIPRKTAYLLRTHFNNCCGPIGYFVTKRPISIDLWPQPMFDSLDIIITARYAPVLTYPEAIQRLRV